MLTPSLDEHLRFVQRRELFCREDFVAQFRVEALAFAVLPRYPSGEDRLVNGCRLPDCDR